MHVCATGKGTSGFSSRELCTDKVPASGPHGRATATLQLRLVGPDHRTRCVNTLLVSLGVINEEDLKWRRVRLHISLGSVTHAALHLAVMNALDGCFDQCDVRRQHDLIFFLQHPLVCFACGLRPIFDSGRLSHTKLR